MVTELARRIAIPEGVEVSIDGSMVSVKGPKGQLSKKLSYPEIEIKKEESDVVVESKLNRKQQRAMVGTLASHINNMIKGVTEGFVYRMKSVYSHFPLQLKSSSNEVAISNFLGERQSRSANILPGAKVEILKDEVIVTGIDKESVGQTMANIEQATRVRRFDVRVFQDGVYLVDKR
jgi:large subunit ribosomal protein L6